MIVVDAGHGGLDPGAIGNEIIEKELTLSISKYMANRFEDLNIPVKMTRTNDETLSPSERVENVLNAFGPDPNVIVISNHINAGGGDGAEVIYPLRNNSELPNLILFEIEKSGQNIRRAYQRRLPSDPSKDYYFMQRETAPLQVITVEYGFLDSTKDDVYQLKNFSNDYAEAVVKAVTEYLNIPYSPPLGTDVYIVKSGESLWSIARNLNINVDELMAVNNLTSSLLTVGQILKIPKITKHQNNDGYVTYEVKAGDNLYNIAKIYNTTVNEIINYNNLISTDLSIGQQLIIPVEEDQNKNLDEILSDGKYLDYMVKSGDSLYSIGRQYGITVDELQKNNNLHTINLTVGQILKIPLSNHTITYIVKKGDNLYNIARKYNTTVKSIMNKNNLHTTNLSVGQQLIIN